MLARKREVDRQAHWTRSARSASICFQMAADEAQHFIPFSFRLWRCATKRTRRGFEQNSALGRSDVNLTFVRILSWRPSGYTLEMTFSSQCYTLMTANINDGRNTSRCYTELWLRY